MAFQLRDETAGLDILYFDNSGNAGLGSLPNSGQSITVQGNSFLSNSAQLGSGVIVPGSQAGYEGVVIVPANSTASIAVSTAQNPTVTASLPASSISTEAVVLGNQGGSDASTSYSIW